MDASKAMFASQLRNYGEYKTNQPYITHSPSSKINGVVNVHKSLEKKNFEKYFSKEKSIIDHNYNIGSSFLPPIRDDSKRNLDRLKFLKLNYSSSKKKIEQKE